MTRNNIGDWWERQRQRREAFEAKRLARVLEREARTLERTQSQFRCIHTAQCASGFGCVNGRCISIGVTGGNGSPNSPGNCPDDDNNCNSGSNACQSEANCGSGSGLVRCCGASGSYQSRENGIVSLSCEKDTSCDSFCNGYYASFGYKSKFCEGREVCDPDCEYCGLSKCKKRFMTESTPCWCDAGARCGACKECIVNPNASTFGECTQTPATRERCKQCLTLESYKCCGQEVGPLTLCGDASGGPATGPLTRKLKEKARAKCSQFCNNCEQKTTKTYCTDTTGLPDSNTLNCPSGIRCRQTGFLDIGGVQCVFVEETDISNCDFKPGLWQFEGTQSYHTNFDGNGGGEVAYRTVTAYFIQGDPGDPSQPSSGTNLANCADGGCYPAMYGSYFDQPGPGAAWGQSISVGGGDCVGNTFGCGMTLFSSQGEGINCNAGSKCDMVDSTDSGCSKKTYWPNGYPNPPAVTNDHFGPGCSLTGTWTYIG